MEETCAKSSKQCAMITQSKKIFTNLINMYEKVVSDKIRCSYLKSYSKKVVTCTIISYLSFLYAYVFCLLCNLKKLLFINNLENN
jgi:hypothetical protein